MKKSKIIKRTQGRNLYFISKSFLKLTDSILPIISFGFYWTDFEYRFTKWHMFKD